MKICLMADSSPHTIRWVNVLVERGHDIHLITLHRLPLDEVDKRVKVHYLKFPAPIGYFLNKYKVNKLLQKIDPDLLHAHYASGYGTLARLVGFTPNILSVWGSDVYLFPYQSNFKERILKKNLEFADRMTVTSSALKEQTEKFIHPAETMEIIPFGIDLDLFETIRHEETEDFICIGTVKSLKKVYGIDVLLKATAQLLTYLRKNHYEALADKIKLMIVGSGPELENLQHLAKNLNLAEVTQFVGAVPNEEVPEYLNELDIYCAFSESESFGVAVLEASACEVPVVVSNIGGLPEVVQDGETGYVVNREDMQGIVDKMFTLVTSKEKRIMFGQNGRQFVKENYNWKRNVDQMEEIYKEVIGDKTR